MPNLRCERFGPFDVEELKEELENLEFEYMMDLAPSRPPTVVRLCECKDEDYEGYHVRVFVGDYEYCVEEGNEAEEVKAMLETMSYETYAEQDLDGVPRFHNWYMALPGKSPHFHVQQQQNGPGYSRHLPSPSLVRDQVQPRQGRQDPGWQARLPLRQEARLPRQVR